MCTCPSSWFDLKANKWFSEIIVSTAFPTYNQFIVSLYSLRATNTGVRSNVAWLARQVTGWRIATELSDKQKRRTPDHRINGIGLAKQTAKNAVCFCNHHALELEPVQSDDGQLSSFNLIFGITVFWQECESMALITKITRNYYFADNDRFWMWESEKLVTSVLSCGRNPVVEFLTRETREPPGHCHFLDWKKQSVKESEKPCLRTQLASYRPKHFGPYPHSSLLPTSGFIVPMAPYMLSVSFLPVRLSLLPHWW